MHESCMVSSAKPAMHATETADSLREKELNFCCEAQMDKLATDAELFACAVVSISVSDVGAPKRA